MGKQRRGGNKHHGASTSKKSHGGGGGKTQSKAHGLKKSADIRRDGMVLEKLKETIARKAAERAAAQPMVEATVGRAVVLAHGAGGSSSHGAMKAWRQRFLLLADEVAMVDFSRPYALTQSDSVLLRPSPSAHMSLRSKNA